MVSLDVVALLAFITVHPAVSSDCNGYCLPQPINLLSGIDTNPRRTIIASSTCGNNSAYTKFPDTGDNFYPRALLHYSAQHVSMHIHLK